MPVEKVKQVDTGPWIQYSRLLEQQGMLRTKKDAMDQGEKMHTPHDFPSAPAAAASPSASSAPVLPVFQPALTHSLPWIEFPAAAAPPGGAHNASAAAAAPTAAAHNKERSLARKRHHSRVAIAEEDMQQLREFEVKVKQAKLEAREVKLEVMEAKLEARDVKLEVMEAQLKAMQGRLKAKQIVLVCSDDEED
jgi:hypothetical protein